jgi:hypothetical protein
MCMHSAYCSPHTVLCMRICIASNRLIGLSSDETSVCKHTTLEVRSHRKAIYQISLPYSTNSRDLSSPPTCMYMYHMLFSQLSFICSKVTFIGVCRMAIGSTTDIHDYRVCVCHVVSYISRMRENIKPDDPNGGQYTAPNKDGRCIGSNLIYLFNLG